MPIPLKQYNEALTTSRFNSVVPRTTSDAPRIRLILVDDDDAYRETIANELEELAFHVFCYPSGDAMLADRAALDQADVIALDWRLPCRPGIDVLRELRNRGVSLPVVFLSGVATTSLENTALDNGALDFVDKGRGVAILAKRLRLVANRSERSAKEQPRPPLCRGPLELRPDFMRATWKNADLGLTLTEFNIVYLLASQPNQYVSYRLVYDCVHHIGFIAGNGEHGFRTNVRSSIKRIRNKFRAIDGEFAAIENFAAVGYRWRD